MATSTSTFYLNISAIKALCQGVSGVSSPGLKFGYVAPTTSIGASGDFFFNIASLSSYQLYGPKTTTWPTSAITLTTAEYLTSYVAAAIDTELSGLTGGSYLALACLKDGGTSGYGILSSLRILNEGADQANRGSLRISTRAGILNKHPHITCSAFSDENFRVDWDGSLTANNVMVGGVITTHSDYETVSGINHFYGDNTFGNDSSYVSAFSQSVAFGQNASAFNTNCIAGGSDSIATGRSALSFGVQTEAIGCISVAHGFNTKAVGTASMAYGVSAVGYHPTVFVWAGGDASLTFAEEPPTAPAVIGSSGNGQAVFYSLSGTHIGKKLSVNNFTTKSFVIDNRIGGSETITLTVPITGLNDATLTVNGTISGNNSITAPNYYDGNSDQLLISRQTAPSRLTDGVSTSADIIAAFNLLLSSLTAHGLVR